MLLGQFAAQCEISTSKSKAMVLDQKKVACSIQVRGESPCLPQVEEFKYLKYEWVKDRTWDWQID